MFRAIPKPGRVAAQRWAVYAALDLPPGRFAVAVSGGADSVAMFHRLRRACRRAGRPPPAVVHLDHQLRGDASAADAGFVADLATSCNSTLWLRRRSELGEGDWPSNPSARYRRMRLACYRQAVDALGLACVALGHHADDVAETLLLRLSRGSPRSGTLGLAPLRPWATVGGVTLWRPMLGVRRERLRTLLRRGGLPWREDASNATDATRRNRARRLLAGRPAVTDALLKLAGAASAAEDWWAGATPPAEAAPRLEAWLALPPPLLRRVARRWLVGEANVPEADAGPGTVDRLLALLPGDGPRALDLPGGARVARRAGRLVRVTPNTTR